MAKIYKKQQIIREKFFCIVSIILTDDRHPGTHFFDMLEAFDLIYPESWHMELSCPIRVDLNVKLLSILTE